ERKSRHIAGRNDHSWLIIRRQPTADSAAVKQVPAFILLRDGFLTSAAVHQFSAASSGIVSPCHPFQIPVLQIMDFGSGTVVPLRFSVHVRFLPVPVFVSILTFLD